MLTSEGRLLACRGAKRLSAREQVVLEQEPSRLSRACRTCVGEEPLRTDPVASQIQVRKTGYPHLRPAGEAPLGRGGQRADGLYTRQVLAIDEDVAPSTLRRIQQPFELALVLARISGAPRIKLLESAYHGTSFGGDACVDRLGGHEPRAFHVLDNRMLG